MTYPSNCVVDTNVLFDVRNGGIVAQFLRLPMPVYVPDVIIDEVLDGSGELFLAHGIRKRELTGLQMVEAQHLRRQRSKVSFNDMCALVVARYSRATLLTGDKTLRNFANELDVDVHGVLWVLDELVRLGTLNEINAARCLNMMIEMGSRLPQDECEKRMLRWAHKRVVRKKRQVK